MISELSQVEQAASEGFDFVQPMRDLVMKLGSEEVERQKARIRGGIVFRVCAMPLPADVRVTQRGFNIYVWTEHLRNALQRLAELGCETLVWSDGRARVLPIEGAIAGSKDQVLQFLYMLCTVAADFGMKALIEPLGPRRTNFLNNLPETAEFLAQVRTENISALISHRELGPIGLSASELTDFVELIGHVQLDNPRAYDGPRVCPRPDDGCDYRPFLEALRSAGYAGDICLPEDADAGGLSYCRGLWES
jgi:sugar phosphate isomerase/epimerase